MRPGETLEQAGGDFDNGPAQTESKDTLTRGDLALFLCSLHLRACAGWTMTLTTSRPAVAASTFSSAKALLEVIVACVGLARSCCVAFR